MTRPGSFVTLASLLLALFGCTHSSGDDEVADTGETIAASSESAAGSETITTTSESSETLSSSETLAESSESGSESSMDGSESGMTCSYPAGAVEPMALGEVLVPYSWTTAIHADGTTTSLDLIDAPCATDEVIDWSVHELLVFISLPAW
ncbi:hypothetical protein ACNOYE_20395 [Nannocystaceae bacterium ST9]